jgi:hypothetical protein
MILISLKFSGKPCKRGHDGTRWKSNGDCVECGYARRRAHPEYDRTADAKRRGTEKRRAQKRAAENARRKLPHAQAARAAERMKRIADQRQRTPAWADHEKIRAFYRLAAAFSKLYVPHHVDHIVPLNGEHVSGIHVEHNLRVIPASDNLRKGAGFLEAA